MDFRNKLFGSVLFFAMAAAPNVNATEILTTTYNAWAGTIVSGSASEWDFMIPNSSYNSAAGYNLNVGSSSYGTTVVTGPDNGGYSLNKNYYGNTNAVGLESAGDGVGSMTFTTSGSGLTAFLLGLGVVSNTAPITVTLSDGETFTANPNSGSTVLLGLSSGTPITSFTLTTASGSNVDLDDFFAGVSNQPAAAQTAPAAEVATSLMIGSGLLVFGARRKVFSNFSRARV